MKKLLIGLALAMSACGEGGDRAAAPPAPAPVADPTLKPYPLKTCVVSGEELGSMGKPIVIAHEGREIKFCCKGCDGKFLKDPKPYVAKLEAAEKK
jgi:hypothetical protein